MVSTLSKYRCRVTSCVMAGWFVFGAFVGVCAGDGPVVGRVEFNRDIRPILSSRCLHCHGPDETTREGELRLDDSDDVVRDRDGRRVIVTGRPGESELYRRLTTADVDERMPPVDSGKQLTDSERELIRRWIAEGAEYQTHWSLIPPKRAALPAVKNVSWATNAIDRFVLARLEKDGLEPSAAAEEALLLRRVTLDLTGLPPTVEELDAFLADGADAAYERVVDRLLASSAYGEHRARYWLDAARYADTAGYFTDDEREMWRWRDWVIGAFNRNMPFDQFTVEQLAGDLLPGATQDQLIATGFNRNHMTTRETGVIDEEYRVEYVVNRVETTSTVWLGLTMGCARCHEHKYDPISQREFYEFYAFFNNVAEKGNSGAAGNAKPVLNVPTEEYTRKLNDLKEQAAAAQAKAKGLEAELQRLQAEWERAVGDSLGAPEGSGLLVHYAFDGDGKDGVSAGADARPNREVEYAAGWLGSAARFDGDTVFAAEGAAELERDDRFSIACWMKSDSGGPTCLVSKNDDADSLRGFDVMLRKGKLVVHLIHKWDSNAIQVMTDAAVGSGRWQHIAVTYDGSSKAAGVRVYVNGKAQPVTVKRDKLTGSIRTGQPFRVGRRSTSAAFRGALDDVRVYGRELPAEEISELYTQQMLAGIVGTPEGERSRSQRDRLREYYLEWIAPDNIRAAYRKAAELSSDVTQVSRQMPSTMVMRENEALRETFVLARGQYDQPGEKVQAGVPRSLPALRAGIPRNRLGLAKWLVDGKHPLTARVTVNRLWQQMFGEGLVKSAEDFGAQGDWPSHPRLLDWLAVEFVESGWDVKRLLKLIVMSSTYRQSSRIPPGLLERDPENRLLARGPRFRLDAEVVRDSSLKVSGLLVEKIGGPSVKPYQPAGLWAAVSYDGNEVYQRDAGEGLYRRSLYTYWKRQSPPPALMAFDAPTRETCTVKRVRTNTPLQALVLLNDTTYIEAARALAQQVMRSERLDETRLIRAFRLVTSRGPDDEERAVLGRILKKQLAYYRSAPEAARKLTSVGDSARDESMDVSAHAAWTVVCSAILNLDEAVTKN